MVEKTGTLDGMQNPQLSESSQQTATFLIRSRFHTLSRSNQKIATYILEHAESLSSMTITQVSQKTGVSPSGVTRFCQAFGFSGFSEFKYYASTNQKSFQLEDKHICPNESFGSVKSKISDLYLQMVRESVALVDENLLYRAVRKMSEADQIVLFSQGGSSAAAQFAQVSLLQIGFPCQCYNDMTISKLVATELTERDVAIGITFSGVAKVPVDALRIAQKQKATTICITGFNNSQIMRYADIPFCYNCKIDDDMRTMNIARICEIGIVGLIHACLLSSDYDRIHHGAEALKNATLQGRYGILR
ncbi:MAG: MurR/RpiR family transcriptional regulator [Dysosmobacter sp.]|nr:MurR/RpiR family transcriptional regulator [Dysosmobacter sp.]